MTLSESQHVCDGVETNAHAPEPGSAVEGRSLNLGKGDHGVRVESLVAKKSSRHRGLLIILSQVKNLQGQHLIEVPPFAVLCQILDVGVVESSCRDVGAHVMLWIAPDIPGAFGELVAVVVELQVVVNVMGHIGCGRAGLQRQSPR